MTSYDKYGVTLLRGLEQFGRDAVFMIYNLFTPVKPELNLTGRDE